VTTPVAEGLPNSALYFKQVCPIMYHSGLILLFSTQRARRFTCKFFKGFQACLKK